MAKQDDEGKYLSILRRIHSGQSVPQSDLEYFVNFHGGDKFNATTYEKLKNQLSSEEGIKNFSDSDWEKYMGEVKNRLTSDPAYREQTLALAQKAGTDKASANFKNGINAVLAGTDIATSLGQIAKSNTAMQQVRMPGRPPVLQRDQMLQQALASAHAGTLDQSAAIAPAQLANLDQYKQDLAAGNTAAAGQPGAYGAYAQVAANRRERGNLNLVPLANDVKRQEQARETQLLGIRQGENQAINQSQSQFYPLDLYQYNTNRQAANELGQIGRYNLRSSLTGAAGALVPLAGQAASRRYNDLYNKMLPYGQDHAQTAAEAAHQADHLWNGGNISNQSQYEAAYGDNDHPNF